MLLYFMHDLLEIYYLIYFFYRYAFTLFVRILLANDVPVLILPPDNTLVLVQNTKVHRNVVSNVSYLIAENN